MALQADTIAALATAPGPSAIAVVRVSGPGALEVLGRVAPELSEPAQPRRASLTSLRDPDSGALLDRCVVTVYPGPNSYTGEDLAEISCHGGWMAPTLVLDACLAAGARRAEPGEFTRRAYLNGKLDLLQAEAVLDLVEGRSPALHQAALHQLDRGLSSRISELREGLVRLEALLTHHIDFPEEDQPPVPVERILAEARDLVAALDALLATAPEGELLREGALTVLAGRPNSGKSSLFNALLGRDRAIVTEVPGTTRDALEAVVSFGGYPFRLVDTAGLRDSDEDIERLGIEVARRYLDAADVVLMCVEAGRSEGEDEAAFLDSVRGRPVVKVRTKTDLLAVENIDHGDGSGVRPGSGLPDGDGVGPRAEVRLSSLSGQGVEELTRLLPALVFRGLVEARGEAPLLIRTRQTRGVTRARDHVRDFAQALQQGLPAEVASTHLRPAETALEELLGIISREDVLDRVFRDFCVGK